MNQTVKSASIADGVALDYVAQGDPAGLPMLLLHGYSDSWRSYERLLPHLPGSIRAIALSQRGHGDSSRPEHGYGARDFATDLHAFMDALAIPAAIIVGHSMGSQAALRLALDHPSRTIGLVLIGASPTFRGNPAGQELWDTVVCDLTDPVDPDFVLAFQKSTLMQDVPPAFLAAAVAESLKVPARVWRAACEALLRDDCSGELNQVNAPTSIIWGDGDGFCSRADQDALLSAIAGATLSVYRGVGHAPHWEEPARVAADLAGFARQRIPAHPHGLPARRRVA